MTPGTMDSFTIYKGKAFGPLTLTCKKSGVAVNITGWTFAAKAHRKSDGAEINLAPSIASAVAGTVNFADFTAANATDNFGEGVYEWDICPTTSGSVKLAPLIAAEFTVKDGES